MSVLEVNNVSKRFGEKTAVDQVHFTVGKGEIFGLLGANGAGKTTTMRMSLGLIAPDEGEIRWMGKPYREELRRTMGYLPEERGLYPKITVKDQLLYLAKLRGMSVKAADQALKEWLERFQVPDYYGKKVEELSKGNQQKIQFIAAVIHNPDIIIMDETFSGLDPVNVELLKETVKELREQGKTMLFSSHRMDHVEELCENICILHRSRMVLKGSLKEIKRSYPRERVKLVTETDVNGLEQVPGVLEVKKHLNGYELRIQSEQAAQEVLATAMKMSSITKFELLEPTLNEIFIKAVGGQNHE
ncbi:ABC transporter ATP-binding protein [Paenibacillus turpanensis]|uniref:ABC transporter ATP-binding protein n=1 Tax=Paenibacillus turpanensis TaxID=2689078 RepID=UPI00140C9F56|nr:ABC transporter ATP-binding protein [Paenibacillus turpanensis]